MVGRRADSSHIKGDNVPDEAILVPGADILGRITRVERYGKRISLGLGPERVLIAFLSRSGLLLPVLRLHWRIGHLITRRYHKGEE